MNRTAPLFNQPASQAAGRRNDTRTNAGEAPLGSSAIYYASAIYRLRVILVHL